MINGVEVINVEVFNQITELGQKLILAFLILAGVLAITSGVLYLFDSFGGF